MREGAKIRLVPLISKSTKDISKLNGKDKIIKVLKDRTKFVGFFCAFFFKQNKLGSKSSCK